MAEKLEIIANIDPHSSASSERLVAFRNINLRPCLNDGLFYNVPSVFFPEFLKQSIHMAVVPACIFNQSLF